MNIYEKLLAIQTELKAPKTQYNSFGKYNYRNCEDILEAVKPICRKYNAVLFLTDDILYVENRHYVRTTATLVNCEKVDEKIVVNAEAREEAEKKGMDGSQVTGASSSYARKYALNGLFDIDDTKDSDTTNQGQDKGEAQTKKPIQNVSEASFDKEQQALDYTLKSGKYAGKKLRDCPIDYLEWGSENWNGQWKENVDIVLAWKQKREKDRRSQLQSYDINDDDEIPFD